MSFDLATVPERLIEAAQHRNLVPLLGAGISRQAKKSAFPNWRGLLDFLISRALTKKYVKKKEGDEMSRLLDKGQYLMVAEQLRYNLPTDEYTTLLKEAFNPAGAAPTEIHEAIFRLYAPLILTTNYDQLIEDAYAKAYGKTANVYTYRGASEVQQSLQIRQLTDRPIIFKLHGSIDEPSSIILTEQDYRKLIYQETGYRTVLSAIFVTHVVLMVGFSFSDRELTLMLETLRVSLKNQSSPDYIFLPEADAGEVESRRFREDFGVEVIPFKPTKGYPEVLQLIEFLISKVGPKKKVADKKA
jgi:NAD-dependent SIR2 family protein deacetylase